MNDNIKLKINRTAKYYIFTFGIKGWNMNDFAAQAGITKRTLYRYVSSKEKLVEQTVIAFISDVQNELEMYLKQSENFIDGIDKIIEVYPKLVEKMSSRVLMDIFKQYPLLEEKLVEHVNDFTKGIVKYFHDAKMDNIIKDECDIEVLIESIQGLILYYSKYHPSLINEKLHKIISMMIHGILI